MISLPPPLGQMQPTNTLPCTLYDNRWPAFWAYGDPWPTQGEIDILESQGQWPTQYTTNYFYGATAGTAAGDSTSSNTVTSAVNLQTCYHVYELLWEQNKLTYFLDGVAVTTKTAAAGNQVGNLWNVYENIVLNVAVGGNYFGRTFKATKIVTGSMLVDWVRVYADGPH